MRKRTLPLFRELERIGKQILEYLLQPLGIGDDDLGGRSVLTSTVNSRPLPSATWRKLRVT